MRGIRAWLGIAVAAVLLFVPASAQATFHLIKIREVHEQQTASDADYVVLQMYSAAQSFVGGHYLITYDAAGNPFQTFQIPNNVPNGQNQRTILIAGMGTIPGGVAPDFTVPAANVFPGPSGSVCYLDAPPSAGLDCVSIGAAAPPATQPSPVGTPVLSPGGIAPGESVIRSIARGCPTLLEEGDDTNDSAADFALGTPNPRNNTTSPITETPCAPVTPDTTPPKTKIVKVKVKGTKAKVSFSGSDDVAGKLAFKCKLDHGKFKSCTSPKTYKHLKAGKHKVRVEAIDAAGNVDATPAKKSFTI